MWVVRMVASIVALRFGTYILMIRMKVKNKNNMVIWLHHFGRNDMCTLQFGVLKNKHLFLFGYSVCKTYLCSEQVLSEDGFQAAVVLLLHCLLRLWLLADACLWYGSE